MSSSGTARMIGPSSAATRCSPTKNDDSPYMRGLALLGVDALVPVDPVLGEVEVLHRPVLALPQLVELAVVSRLASPRSADSCRAGSLVARKSTRSVLSGEGSVMGASLARDWLAGQLEGFARH